MVFLPHMVWLVATALAVVGCMRMARASARGHRIFCVALFVVVLVNEGAWFAYRHFAVGMPLAENLPLHLCDLSVFALLTGLATGWRPFAEWAYYPGVVGALLAVVFPAVSETGAIRAVAEVRYFVTHIALVGAGFYFTFGRLRCGGHPAQYVPGDQLFLHDISAQRSRLHPRLSALAVPGGGVGDFSGSVRVDAPALRPNGK